MRLKDLKKYEILEEKIKNKSSILLNYEELYKILESFIEKILSLNEFESMIDESMTVE